MSSVPRYVPGSHGVQPVRSAELVSPEGQNEQMPMLLCWLAGHATQLACASSGCVPGGQAAQEMPSVEYSLLPQASQKVE